MSFGELSNDFLKHDLYKVKLCNLFNEFGMCTNCCLRILVLGSAV